MAAQQVSLTHGPLCFAGAVSLEVSGGASEGTSGGGVQPWRTPLDQHDLFEPPLLTRSSHAAGVRLSFLSDTSTVEMGYEPAGEVLEDPWCFDLVVDGQLHERITRPMAAGRVRFEGLPAGEHWLELWLPQFGAIRVRSLAIDEGADLRAVREHRPRWVVYGSSITHCRQAAGPTQTWPALVAQQFGLDLMCLGYGGQCHMDPMVARMIRDLPADYLSLCVGINIHGGSWSERTFRAGVIGLIKTIRDGHPHTPMVVVSPICSPPRETQAGGGGMTLPDMRRKIADAVAALRQHGDEQLIYIDGLDLFGPEFVRYMPDELHPDAEGIQVLARRYAERVMPRLGLKPRSSRPEH